MNDRSTKLKRMADSERKSRTDLIKSILSGAKQMVSLGTFLYGHPDLIGWVPKDRRIYLATQLLIQVGMHGRGPT